MALDLSDITPTLSVGQVFKNYKELCSTLQIEVRDGKSKRLQMQEVERFISLNKQGHKFIIAEIYPTPIPKNIKENKRNSKYKNLIEYQLIEGLYELTRNNENKNIVIICTFKELAYNLSMINDYFNPCIYDDSLPFDQESYSNAYYALRQTLKGYIDTALKSLERNHEINYSREKLLVIDYEHQRLLTEEEKNWYNEEFKSCLYRLNQIADHCFGKPRIIRYKDFGDIIAQKKVYEFYAEMDSRIKKKFDSSARIYDVYRISTTAKLIDYAKERVCDRDKLLETAKALNGKLCDMVDENILQWFDIPHNLDKREKAFLALTVTIDEDSYGWHIESLLRGTGYEKVIVGESFPAIDAKELQAAS